MRILGVSVIGLVELASCWQERDEARQMTHGKSAPPRGDRSWDQDAALAGLDKGREHITRAYERHQERG